MPGGLHGLWSHDSSIGCRAEGVGSRTGVPCELASHYRDLGANPVRERWALSGARTAPVILGQGPSSKALRAAATARSTSAVSASATSCQQADTSLCNNCRDGRVRAGASGRVDQVCLGSVRLRVGGRTMMGCSSCGLKVVKVLPETASTNLPSISNCNRTRWHAPVIPTSMKFISQ